MAELGPQHEPEIKTEGPADLSDEKHVRKRNQEVKRYDAEREQVINSIMQTTQGRRFILWLLTISRINDNIFATNALVMAYRSGEVNIGQQVQALATTINNLDLYVQMLKEGAKRDN